MKEKEFVVEEEEFAVEKKCALDFSKALVTVKDWFIAPNNRLYKAVYGELVFEDKEIIVINNVRINKSEILSVIFSDYCNDGQTLGNWGHNVKHGFDEYETPCQIYFAKGVN